MKKKLILIFISVVVIACKNPTSEIKNNNSTKGIYEAIFIDINDTKVSDSISQDVLLEKRLLANVNLTDTDDFWGSKNSFYMHAMGTIEINKSGMYHFKLTNAGNILFRLNNKELVKNQEQHERVIDTGKMFLEKGQTIFEYEYFPGSQDPHLVLEWSKDGTNYEVVPDSLFNNLDDQIIDTWKGEVEMDTTSVKDNTLTVQEQKEGWKLLFDGKTTNGWHTYNKPGTIGRKWKAKDGMLIFEGRKRFEFLVAGRRIEIGHVDKVKDGGEDIVSDKAYENFELTLEWKVSKGGNNGIFYTVHEDEKYSEIWYTSPEMQVIDDQVHKDGLIYKHRAGDLYDLIASDPIRVRPQGNWNKVRIIKNNGKVEHWLNGTRVVSYDTNSEEWKDMISKSKFSELTNFANSGPGKIGFQDHDNEVHYKNIKIKEL